MSGVESAANAFDVAMGNTGSHVDTRDGGAEETIGVESLFGNVGNLDDDSPLQGGGDGFKPPKVKTEEEDENGDADIDPKQNKAKKADPEEGDEDGEADPDADADDEESGDDPEYLNDVFEVTVDGEKKEVSLREALDGYIRTETFHTRLNELNGVRNELASVASKVIEQRQTYVAKLDTVEKILDSILPQEPDWAAEYRRDPDAASAAQNNYNALKQQIDLIRNEKAKEVSSLSEQDTENRSKYIQRENQKILSAFPHWSDPEKLQADFNLMAETARRVGFSEEEIKNTVDSRMISLLYKAAKYDKLQATKPKPIRRGNKPVKPGAGSNGTAPKGNQRASANLRRSGSLDDAANVFSRIIQRK